MSFSCKKAKIFQELYPVNPNQGSTINPVRSLQHLKTLTCILQHSKTQSKYKKPTLVELLGKIPTRVHTPCEISHICHCGINGWKLLTFQQQSSIVNVCVSASVYLHRNKLIYLHCSIEILVNVTIQNLWKISKWFFTTIS